MLISNDVQFKNITCYLSKIGRSGGIKSRRKLSPQTAKMMVKIRIARNAYKKYYNQCFWSYDPNYKIGEKDIQWVAKQLMKNGDLKLWQLGTKLCL